MSQTDLLQLPYILPGQSQKHVTHNEAIRRLDALVQLSVISRSIGAPPVSPETGDRYIAPIAAQDAWENGDQSVFAWQDGTWTELAPSPGWLAWVQDETALIVWTGTDWVSVGASTPGPSVPDAPVLAVATAGIGPDEVTLNWPAVAGEVTGFESQYQRTDAVDWTGGPAAAPTDTSLTISALDLGTAYRFRIRAMGGAGPSAWSNTVDAQTLAFTVFVDPARGDDTGPGTFAAPYATLTALQARLNALNDGEAFDAYVAAATYTDQTLVTSDYRGAATITFAPGCRIEWTQAAVSASCISANGRSDVPSSLTVYGNGLEIDGFISGTGNGLSSNWSTLIAHDVFISNCSDGMSAHGGGRLEAYRCHARDCLKYAVSHVNDATSYHEDCFFQPADDPTGGIVLVSNALQHVFDRCTFLPPSSGQITVTGGAGTQFSQCELGGLSQTIQLKGTVNATDCFVNATMDSNASGTMSRLFGKLSLRLREAGTVSISDSVFAGSPNAYGLLYTNYTPSSIGDVSVQRCVATGYTGAAIALGNADRLALWDASNSAVEDCVFDGNTVDFDSFASQAARITGNTQVDPGMGAGNSLLMADYAVTIAGAGFQANAAVLVGAPASVRP